MARVRPRRMRASNAPSALAGVLCVGCLGACGEAAPRVLVAAAPAAQGRFTGPVAPVERREERPQRLELEGASVDVPAWFEPLSAERLEALRLDMGGRDPARRVTIAVMRAPQGHSSTVVQVSHTALSAKSAGAPVRGLLEAQIDAMKKTMVHPAERVLQFGTTQGPTSIDFRHIAQIEKPSGEIIQIHTRGAAYVTTDGRAVRSQVECVAQPAVANQLCGPIVATWQLTSPPSLPLDSVIGPA